MENLKIGDTLYLQERARNGKPLLTVHVILKKTPKQYVVKSLKAEFGEKK